MRMIKGNMCKDCCYYIIDEGDTMAYCCIEPLYTEVKPNQPACESYTSDVEDNNNNTNNINSKQNIDYDDDNDNLNYLMF